MNSQSPWPIRIGMALVGVLAVLIGGFTLVSGLALLLLLAAVVLLNRPWE